MAAFTVNGRLSCGSPRLVALGTFGALTKLKSAANDLPYTRQVAPGLFGQCNVQASKVRSLSALRSIQTPGSWAMPTGCPGGFVRLLLGVGVPAESSLELTHCLLVFGFGSRRGASRGLVLMLFCRRACTCCKPGGVLPEGVYML